MEKTCKNCGQKFADKQHPNKVFCSKICYTESIENKKTLKNCSTCKTVFRHKASDTGRKYCSIKCKHLGTTKARNKRTCELCSKTFYPTTQQKHRIQRFCSKGCVNKSRGGKEQTIVCQKCGKLFNAVASRKTAIFCSLECRIVERTIIKCKNCGKEFTDITNPNRQNCSRKCHFAMLQKEIIKGGKKACSKCKKLLPLKFFSKSLHTKNGCHTFCRICSSYVLAAHRATRRAKERNAGGKYTSKQWQEKLVYFGYKCYLCGDSLKDRIIHAEHRKPLSRGGTNWIANIAPACEKCNLKKHTKTEKEFRQLANL